MNADDLIYDALTELVGIDTHDISLRDHPRAWEVLERFRARDRQSRSDEDRRASPEGPEPGPQDAPKNDSPPAEQAAREVSEPLTVRTFQDQLDAEQEVRAWVDAMLPKDRHAVFWGVERKAFAQPSEGGSVTVVRAHNRVVAAAICIRDDFNRTNLIRWEASAHPAAPLSVTVADPGHVHVNGVRYRVEGGETKPDMFWNDADPERSRGSIFEVVDDAFGDGSVSFGDVMTIQRAIRLPNVQVRVVPMADDPEYPDYEFFEPEAAATPESAAPQPTTWRPIGAAIDALRVLRDWDHRGGSIQEQWDEIHGRGAYDRLLSAPTAGPAAPQPASAPTLTERLQQKCSDWGAYWRASDAHGVQLSVEQATELLADALGVEVEIGLTVHHLPGTSGDSLEDGIAALIAQPASAQVAEPVAWQPIETAPIEGEDQPLHAIVAAPLDSGVLYVEEAWYDEQRNEWWPANVDYGDAHGQALYPTHWLALPAAPGAVPSVQPADRARVGDVMVVSVRLPYPQTHRLILETPAAVRYANELLADPKSGWVLESVTKDRE
jgi:hypothetical protein